MESRTHRTRQQAITEFNELDECYAALSRKYTREQLLWRPDGGTAWCIAECVEHVALANAAYMKNIQAALSRTAVGPIATDTLDIAGWPSAMFLKSVSPEGKIRNKAPKKIRPVSVDSAQAFNRLAATHKEILAVLRLQPLPDVNRLRFQNPFFFFVRFTVASGILILAAHGHRHLLQAERIQNLAGFP